MSLLSDAWTLLKPTLSSLAAPIVRHSFRSSPVLHGTDSCFLPHHTLVLPFFTTLDLVTLRPNLHHHPPLPVASCISVPPPPPIPFFCPFLFLSTYRTLPISPLLILTLPPPPFFLISPTSLNLLSFFLSFPKTLSSPYLSPSSLLYLPLKPHPIIHSFFPLLSPSRSPLPP